MPPNIFDDFIRATDTEHLSKIIAAEAHPAKLEASLAEANTRRAEADTRREAEVLAAQRMAEVARSAAVRADTRREAEVLAAPQMAEVTRSAAVRADTRREAEVLAAQQMAEVARSAAVRAAEDADHRTADAEAQKERAAAAWRRTAIAEAKAAQAETREAAAQGWLEAIRASTSWQLTAPLRGVSQFVRDSIDCLAGHRMSVAPASPNALAALPVAQPSVAAGDVPASFTALTYDAHIRDVRGLRIAE